MKTRLLGEVAKIYNGNSINERVKAQKFMHKKVGTPYIATKDISFTNKVNYDNGVKIPNLNAQNFKLAKKGSVLLCAEGGSAGRKMAIIERDVFFVNKLFCFETSAELNSKFLFYYIQGPDFQGLFKNSISGLIGGVSLQKVRNLTIQIPSQEVQKKIVARLDKAFAEIELLEKNLELKEEKTNKLLHAILNDALAENQEFEMKRVKLGEAVSLIATSQTKVKSSSYLASGKYPVVDQGQHLISGYTNERTTVENRDLPVMIFGDHTRVVKYIDFPFTAGADGIKILKPNPLAHPKYLFYLILFKSNQIKSKGYARHFGELKKHLFSIPSLGDQKQIAEKLDKAFAEIELLKSHIAIEKQKVDALRQSILSDAFNFADGAA